MLHVVLLVLLGWNGGAQCLMQEPVVVCRFKTPNDMLSSRTPCTHIVYGSYEMRYEYNTLRMLNSKPHAFNNLKRENPTAKLIPYFSTVTGCPQNYGYSLSWSWMDPTQVDGVAFSLDSLLRCQEDGVRKLLDALTKPSAARQFVSIGYSAAKSSSFKDVLRLLPRQLDMVVWNNTGAWASDDKFMKKQNMVVHLRLNGRLIIETNQTFFNWNGPQNREVRYVKLCSTIKAENILPEWDNRSYSPYIKQAEGKIYFENEQSSAYKAQLILDKGYGGVSVDLEEDDSEGACGETYPLISAMRRQYLRGSPLELISTKTDDEVRSQAFEETVSYCMWKNTMVTSSVDLQSISSCSFIGFEPASEEDKVILKSLTRLPVSNPLLKLIFAMNVRYIFWDSFNTTHLESFMRSYNIAGLDIIVDTDLSEEDMEKLTRILEQMKNGTCRQNMIVILTIRSGQYTIYQNKGLRNLTQKVDYINLAHFYGNDTDTASDVISAAPLTSSFDDKNILFSISHAITLGVPPHKILVGIPNFGYMYKLNSDHTKTAFQEISFKEVCEQMEKLTGTISKKWDTFSATPYFENSNTYYTYENSTSIQMKLDFATKRGLRGVSLYWIDSEECGKLSSDGKTASKQIKDFIVLKNNRSWLTPS